MVVLTSHNTRAYPVVVAAFNGIKLIMLLRCNFREDAPTDPLAAKRQYLLHPDDEEPAPCVTFDEEDSHNLLQPSAEWMINYAWYPDMPYHPNGVDAALQQQFDDMVAKSQGRYVQEVVQTSAQGPSRSSKKSRLTGLGKPSTVTRGSTTKRVSFGSVSTSASSDMSISPPSSASSSYSSSRNMTTTKSPRTRNVSNDLAPLGPEYKVYPPNEQSTLRMSTRQTPTKASPSTTSQGLVQPRAVSGTQHRPSNPSPLGYPRSQSHAYAHSSGSLLAMDRWNTTGGDLRSGQSSTNLASPAAHGAYPSPGSSGLSSPPTSASPLSSYSSPPTSRSASCDGSEDVGQKRKGKGKAEEQDVFMDSPSKRTRGAMRGKA